MYRRRRQQLLVGAQEARHDVEGGGLGGVDVGDERPNIEEVGVEDFFDAKQRGAFVGAFEHRRNWHRKKVRRHRVAAADKLQLGHAHVVVAEH